MYSFLLFPVFFLVLLVTTCAPTNPSVEWNQDWSGELPSGGTGMHRGWVGFGSDHDGGKYVENGWQNSWQSGNSGGNSALNKKQTLGDKWDTADKGKWLWGNGGSRSWGKWGTGMGKHKGANFGDDLSIGMGMGMGVGMGPESSYISWGNINTNSWKNSGGGEGWRKWEANGNEPGNGGRERGEWKSWKSGSGGGNWDSWKNSNKPISAKAEAHASASIDP
uniref:Uncharacterized protein n=2 Tax=Wuchereria bancrofti TaxID=6293 RepID=A0A1I8EVD8_WUCBA